MRIYTNKNNNKEKTVINMIAVFSLCIAFLFLIFVPIYLIVTNQLDSLNQIIFRLAIFYMGTIITMSIFILNLSQKMSPNKYLKNSQPSWLMLGVSFSFITVITNPESNNLYHLIIKSEFVLFFYNGTNYLYGHIIEFFYNINGYFFNHHFLKKQIDNSGSLLDINIKLELYGISKFIHYFNIICFIISSVIFAIVLYKFFVSLNVTPIIEKNNKRILSVNGVRAIKELDLNVITVDLSDKESEKLISYVEIFSQNIQYLVALNSIDAVKKYLSEWNNSLNHIVTLIFHTRNLESSHEKLYNKILSLQKHLILFIAKKKTFDSETDELIKAMFKFLPSKNLMLSNSEKELELYKLKNTQEVYYKNIESLTNNYFLELHNLLYELHIGDKPNVYNKLLNGSIDYHAFAPSIHNIEKSIETKLSISSKIEDLFILSIFKIIELNESIDLSIITGLLLDNDENSKNQLKSIIHQNVSDNPNKEKIKIPNRTIRNLILCIIKACEVENYKAAGYITKIISIYADWDIVYEIIPKINEKISVKNYKFTLCNVHMTFNKFSLNYCFQKTIVLLALQYSYKDDYENQISLKQFLIEKTHNEILDTFEDRKKEYNLSSIDKENIILYKVLNLD